MVITNIKAMIRKLIDLQEQLQEFAELKTTAIKNGDIDALNQLITREEVTVKALSQLEAKREAAVRDYLAHHGASDVKGSFDQLIAVVPEAERDELNELQLRLASAVLSLKQANDLNQQLLQQSLQWVQLNLNLLQPQSKPANYEHPNKNRPKQPSVSRIDSRA